MAVTSPKKGLGQTVMAINLAMMFAKLTGKKCLLIDFNQKFRDVAKYLSESKVNKGIDDFKNMYSIGVENESDIFKKCTKQVSEKIDIMTSNICMQIDERDVKNIVEHSSKEYSFVIADTIASDGEITKNILAKAEVVITVLSQDTNVLELATNGNEMCRYNSKNIFIVNKYVEEINGSKISLDFKKIKMLLQQKGIMNESVFKLDFDGDLINECNNKTLLNYIFNSCEDTTINCGENGKIVEHILGKYANHSFVNESKQKYKAKWDIKKILRASWGVE